MKGLILSQFILAAVVMLLPGDVTGQFTAASPICPGDTFTFRCNVTGDMNGITIWRVGGGSTECTLLHSTVDAPRPCVSGRPFIVTTGTGFGTNAISFSSTLSGTATSGLNSTLVECFGPALPREPGNRVGGSTLQTIGSPIVNIFNHSLSELVNETVNVTVSWTLSGGDSADFYLISITTNTPQTPYGGLLNITTGSVTQCELTGFMAGYEYNITVRGVNCGCQKGRESEPLTIRPQVPYIPADCNCTAVYSQSSGRLLFINSNWDTVPNPVDPCPGVSGDITQYQISFQTVSSVVTENVNIAECINGRCSHTFMPPSNLSSSYYSVLAAAENVVGRGAVRACTTQTIFIANNLLNVEVESVSSPSDARTVCTFLSGFTGSARCKVQYGTDPTYMNLPYSAESTESGTAGDSVSVVLRERLNSSTEYYYTVSAVSGDITVVVQGTFTTQDTPPPYVTGGTGCGGGCILILIIGAVLAASSTLLYDQMSMILGD